jgi:archaellum biogenesis ATPase FlaH/5S rRNA maturation endonuclease (ribonuclease M5)
MDHIQEIKNKYGNSAENIIANGLSLQKKMNKYRCPNSIAHKNGDRNPSMSWDNNALQFHCFTCGMNIDIYGYYRQHLNYSHQEIIRELLGDVELNKTSMEVKRNEFTKYITEITNISDECINYIKLRGMNEETIKHFDIKSYRGMIAFPYFKYETVVGYKLRKPIKDPGHPKMSSIPGSKPYLFNYQNVINIDELIICEGEFDCMVIHQCGYTNVVSVGAGANSLNTLLEQCKDFINKFRNIILVSDNDEAGSNMDKIFVDEFKDKVRLIDKTLYTKNDINEEFVLKGKQAVINIIDSARFKIEGRRDLDNDPYKGILQKEGSYIPTGLPTIDNAINDLIPGGLTILGGRSNGGKTTFTKQIIANAINLNNKVYVLSGEGTQEMFINEIYQCVIGRNKEYYYTLKVNKRFHKEPKKEVLEALRQWHKNKLVLFNKGDSKLKTAQELLDMLDYEIKINRYNLVVIDNLMSVVSFKSLEKYEAQSDFVQRCVDISKTHKTHIILVVHPNKEYSKGKSMEMEHISGTMDIGNKADNVISVIREYDEAKLHLGISGRIEVVKNRYYPELVSCNIHFDSETGMLNEIMNDSCTTYKFNWEKYLPQNTQKQFQTQQLQIEGDESCPF